MTNEKNLNYYTNIRKDILSFLPRNNDNHILEVGCGYGNTLLYLKSEGICAWACGVELIHDAAEYAVKH